MARGGRARGHNGFGQLGVGDTADRGLPTPVGNATWKTLAAGGYHTCGIQTDSSLWCWGGNGRGQLGDGTADPRLLPTRIGSGTAWTTTFAELP